MLLEFDTAGKPVMPVAQGERVRDSKPTSDWRAHCCAGVLVAVAVLDVLPRCLSSKYVFWDPDLAHLSLGKLTALREIAWVQAAARACPRLHYYYQVPLPALTMWVGAQAGAQVPAPAVCKRLVRQRSAARAPIVMLMLKEGLGAAKQPCAI